MNTDTNHMRFLRYKEIEVPRRTLKTETEIEVWIDEVTQQLKAALKKGPIVIR